MIRRSSRVRYPIKRFGFEGYATHHYAYMVKVVENVEPTYFEDAIVKNCVVGGLAQAATSNMRSTHKEKLTQEHTKRDGGQNVFLLVSSSSSSHFTTYTKCR